MDFPEIVVLLSHYRADPVSSVIEDGIEFLPADPTYYQDKCIQFKKILKYPVFSVQELYCGESLNYILKKFM